jgi:hypothetical protein
LVDLVLEVVVLVDEAVPELGTLDPAAPRAGVVFAAGASWEPAEPEDGAGELGATPADAAVGFVGVVAGADVLDVTPPVSDPLPLELPPPPLDDATGTTPGQAWAKAAAGVTDGFVAVALSGPGSWNRQPWT